MNFFFKFSPRIFSDNVWNKIRKDECVLFFFDDRYDYFLMPFIFMKNCLTWKKHLNCHRRRYRFCTDFFHCGLALSNTSIFVENVEVFFSRDKIQINFILCNMIWNHKIEFIIVIIISNVQWSQLFSVKSHSHIFRKRKWIKIVIIRNFGMEGFVGEGSATIAHWTFHWKIRELRIHLDLIEAFYIVIFHWSWVEGADWVKMLFSHDEIQTRKK